MHTVVRSTAEFAALVTGVGQNQLQAYIEEIRNNLSFHDSMESNRKTPTGRRSPRASVNAEVGSILYAICRALQPDNVAETGVAAGVSSSYFLCALEGNKKGRLFSIDFPTWEAETGWIVPAQLRHRWELISGRSSERLVPLLERLEKIQVFFHDGEHSYENMIWEYENAWSHLEQGGVLLSHNIDFTEAFPDFANKLAVRSYSFQNLGGIAKP